MQKKSRKGDKHLCAIAVSKLFENGRFPIRPSHPEGGDQSSYIKENQDA